MTEYYKLIEKNIKMFERAIEIAKSIKNEALELFEDCDVFIIGSYAKGEHKLSSDLDILITSEKIPEKINFEWYSSTVKKLTNDTRINIHLLNKDKFEEYKKLYSPMIQV
ncbi:nucleotidyltransferase domain-containing protein [Archaeoglobales archaeon]|nr:MAG: nucleotidyltransferase domain-containing protein [Archaeoglobales archaeon]